MKLMHLLAAGLTLLLALTQPAAAQQTAGTITYEGMRRIDPSEIRIVINGNPISPGSPDAPPLPDVSTFSQQLIFAGNYAHEVREAPNMVIRRFEGAVGEAPAGPARQIAAPLTESRYLDLARKTIFRVLEVKKDSATHIYRAEEPFPVASDWKETGKNRKIAGYTCRKATARWKDAEYTIWYTTELPLTYSPITELTPATGVVLLVESDTESFKASGVKLHAVAESEVKPAGTAQPVSLQELDKLREKAMADFRQQMFSNPSFN